MKRMITMTGKSFSGAIQAVQDFVNKRPAGPVTASKIQMKAKRDQMAVHCFSTDGYMESKFVGSCLEIDGKEDFSFFISVPPLLPKADEVVKILVEDETTVVEYVTSGYMFRTNISNTAEGFDHESYLAGLMAKPAFRIAVNPNYLKKILQSLIRSNDAVRSNRAPIYMDFAGEDQPIRIFADDGDHRVLLPVRNRRPGNINIKELLGKAEPEVTVKKPDGGIECCPRCNHELKFLRSRMTAVDDIKACPYCGQQIQMQSKMANKEADKEE